VSSHRFPDFYILGAPKAGTSSLAQYLDEHDQIFVSKPKEPRYFAEDFDDRIINDETTYLDLFKDAPANALLGEATTDYLLSEVAVDRILAVRPDAKFIAMLRNPSQMVFAMHAQERKNGYETIADPEGAWAAIDQRRAGQGIPALCGESKRLLYDDRCRLGEQVQRLISKVAPEQIKLIFLDDFSSDTERLYRDVLGFLGIESFEPRDFPVHNTRHYIKHPHIIQFWKMGKTIKDKLGLKTNFGILRTIQDFGLSSQPTGDEPDRTAFRTALRDYFEPDIRLLEKITGRDLSDWRHVA
jgi:hypothetical protein